jgi:hypothetical protein
MSTANARFITQNFFIARKESIKVRTFGGWEATCLPCRLIGETYGLVDIDTNSLRPVGSYLRRIRHIR